MIFGQSVPAHASNQLSGSPNVDQPPGTIFGIKRVLVGLAEEVNAVDSLFEFFKVVRETAGLVIEQADGAGIFLATPDQFCFFTPTFLSEHVRNSNCGSNNHQSSKKHSQKQRVPTFARVTASRRHCNLPCGIPGFGMGGGASLGSERSGGADSVAGEEGGGVSGATISRTAWRPVEIS